MAKIAVVLLCFMVLMQSARRTWIVTTFKANQSTIAQTLCENKSVQNSTCAGKCYLKKQLAANEAKEKANQSSDKERFEYISNYVSSFFDLGHSFAVIPSVKHSILWNCGKAKQISTAIFHPPTA